MGASSWICTSGSVNEKKGVIKYIPTEAVQSDPSQGWNIGIIKSDTYFKSGSVGFELKLTDPTTFCQVVLGAHIDPIYFGINEGSSAYSIKAWNTTKRIYIPLNESGLRNTIPLNEFLKIEINIDGSLAVLKVNNVEVLHATVNINRAPLTLAFWGAGGAEVRNVKISHVRPKVFAVMQFTEEFNELYKEVIEPVCENFELEVIRADDIYNNGLIIQDIINSINEASIIIADITPDNPNVYYEVGYSHAVGKPVILLCDNNREKLPFDISGFRTIFYKNKISGKSAVEAQLKKHLEALMPHNKSN